MALKNPARWIEEWEQNRPIHWGAFRELSAVEVAEKVLENQENIMGLRWDWLEKFIPQDLIRDYHEGKRCESVGAFFLGVLQLCQPKRLEDWL